MDSNNRLRQFEEMLLDIQKQYADVCSKMDALKDDGKEKSVTFKQLFASKLTLLNILIIYKSHGIIDSF